MTNTEIILKLIGPVKPVGESHSDQVSNENLKELCSVTQDLVQIVRDIYIENKDRHQASMKQAADIAENCLIDYNIPHE